MKLRVGCIFGGIFRLFVFTCFFFLQFTVAFRTLADVRGLLYSHRPVREKKMTFVQQ